MVFCAYCGKGFTRKEHLERHIPSHTNVKPHRCSFCQLSFSRRDLLQRHHSTYHEVRDLSITSSDLPIISGKTPIACINCASAKTGCDKRVPCSRCADKNLPCAARFARRSSKAAFRATAAVEIQQKAAEKESEPLQSPGYNSSSSGHNTPVSMSAGIEPYFSSSPGKRVSNSPKDHTFSSGSSELATDNFEGMDFFQYDAEFTTAGLEMMTWSDFPMEVDPYKMPMELSQSSYLQMTVSDTSGSASGSDVTGSSYFSSISNPHTRNPTIRSAAQANIRKNPQENPRTLSQDLLKLDFEALLISESAWPFVRCNEVMFSGACPQTAVIHLEKLEQISSHKNAWTSLEGMMNQFEPSILVENICSGTRDKILAITQSFLHRAVERHTTAVSRVIDNKPPRGFSFLVLPPTEVLEFFLDNCIHSLVTYYSLTPSGKLDLNEMMLNEASTLLVLLMMAQGAMSTPTDGARYLTAGLIEICRISLFDIIERDVELCADPVVLRCGLLFMILGAWSGDKWHADITMGQRSMYMAMVKHSGMLEAQVPSFLTSGGPTDPELQWRSWIQTESKNRLVYDWVFVDLELSLFHDTAPLLSISEMETPLPDSECLWLARDSAEWLKIVQDTYYAPPSLPVIPQFPKSLCNLFQDLLHDNLNRGNLTPLMFRLLLHPIQSLLCHLRQIISCFSDVLGSRRNNSHTMTKASTLTRLEEVQTLLQNWYSFHKSLSSPNQSCIITHTNLILYHLLSLNCISSFPEIERVARSPSKSQTYWDLSLSHNKCIAGHQITESNFHAGQILRLAKTTPKPGRPQWLPVAVYRATMILWVNCLANGDANFPPEPPRGDIVRIDEAEPDDPSIINWLWRGEGVPVLCRGDAVVTKFECPGAVLGYCIGLLSDGVFGQGRLVEGIVRKLELLERNWHGGEGGEMGRP